MSFIYLVSIIFISAFFTGISHQPIGFGWLAWFSLIPIIFIINKINSIKEFILFGYLWGLVYYVTIIFWLVSNNGTTQFIGIISLIIAVCFCSLNFILIFLFSRLIKKLFTNKWYLLFPFVWVVVEYIRNQDILSGGAWTSLANTQLDYLILAQNVEFTGIYGISFWIVLINVLLYNWLLNPFSKNILFYLVTFILPWLTGLYLIPDYKIINDYKLNVAVVQPNIHQSQKWRPGSSTDHISNLINYSKNAINNNVDLIIWPETATSSFVLQRDKKYLKWIQNEIGNANLISGIPYYDEYNLKRRYYNSAMHIDKDSIFSIYHKIKLVPMGEYVPLSRYFPILNKINLGQGNFSSGVDYTIMKVKNINCATMICFESTIPSINREFVNKGAEVIVYIVNDGWYEKPPQPQQHARQVIYRAIENRRPIVRCSNTGISMIVDPIGNILDKISLNKQGVIQSTLFPQKVLTFYTRYGDIFAQLIIIIIIIVCFIGFLKRNE